MGSWGVMGRHGNEIWIVFGKSSGSIPGESLSIRIEFSVGKWFISTYSDQKIIDFKVRSAEAGIVTASHREPWSHVHRDWSLLCKSHAWGTKFAVSDLNGPCWHSTFVLVVRSTLRSRGKMWKVRGPDRGVKFGSVLLSFAPFCLMDLHSKLNPKS